MNQRKPYNYNTQYGRRKLREQARLNYENGDQEYRDDIDQYKGCIWAVVIIIALLFFILIATTQGIDEALKWLR